MAERQAGSRLPLFRSPGSPPAQSDQMSPNGPLGKSDPFVCGHISKGSAAAV